MTENMQQYYTRLELRRDASLEDAKRAYRNLVKLWHPDRFADNHVLQSQANEKLCKINEAYEKVIFSILQKEQLIRKEVRKPVYDEPPRPHGSNLRSRFRVSQGDLFSLLGKSRDSVEVSKYMANLKESPYMEPYGSFYEFKNNGIGFLFNQDILISISLFAKGYRGYRQFRGNIPGGLSFFNYRQDVKEKIGEPAQSGEWKAFGDNRQKMTWDKWVLSKYTVYIEYYKDGKIAMITLEKRRSAG
jgi:curved DNA-binding protein CbpA